MFTFLIIILVVAVVWAIQTYNKLQSSKQNIIEQASNMQISLQKRRDLASRILDIAQGFGDHEKVTHLKISSNQTASIESLSALGQSFPELKANETYLQLMKQLEELENNISNKRESYNRSVKSYNSYRSNFPTMLVAQKLNFEAAPYYDAGSEDMLSTLATFTRDDSAAVQHLISSTSSSLLKSANELKESASKQLEQAKNSEAMKTVVAKSDAVISKAVDAIKSRTTESSTEIKTKEPEKIE